MHRISYGTRKRSSFGIGHGFPFVERPNASGGNVESDGRSGGGRNSGLRSRVDSICSTPGDGSPQRVGRGPWQRPVVDEKTLRDGGSTNEDQAAKRRGQNASAFLRAGTIKGMESPGMRVKRDSRALAGGTAGPVAQAALLAEEDFDYRKVLRRKRERQGLAAGTDVESGAAALWQTQGPATAAQVTKLAASLRAQVQSPIQKRLNKLRFATPNVTSRTNQRLRDAPAPDTGRTMSQAGGTSEVGGPPVLPRIDFSKINRLRVQNKWNGTGRDLREDLISLGGAAKFYRTKRQNMMINKPFSMFDGTHLQTSSRAHQI